MRIKNDRELTAYLARTLVDYDPATGLFLWRPRPLRHDSDRRTASWNERHAGEPAVHTDHAGIGRVVIYSRAYLARRLAWLITKGRWPKRDVFCVDGDHANLRISNLKMKPPPR